MDLQQEIEKLRREVEILRNRSVHNQMTFDTRKNILDAVVPSIGFLTGDNSGLETAYSTLQVFYKNTPYNLVIAPTDPTTATNSIGIVAGTGAPTLHLPKGTLYIRTDGSTTATRMYIATDSAGTWTNFTTAA